MKADNSQTAKRKGISREEILEGPILPTLIRLAAPTIAVIAAQTMVAVVETYWIAKLGTSALAGAALVVPMVVLMATMSNGGIGGGVSSAIARAIGAGDRGAAERLLWHAIALAVIFGAVFTAVMLAAGPAIYATLGGKGAALDTALTYSNWTFAAAIPLWAVNLIAAALRGAGDPVRPARVTLAGAVLTAALSPAFIFGVGPLPAMGVAGAGAAIGLYYVGALAVLLTHLASGRGALKLTIMPLERAAFAAILRVGLASSLGTLLTNVTVIAVTGAVGLAGANALAGYGIASRLDSLLIPPLFGLGTAVIAMAGAAIGAGRPERAYKVAWTAALFGAAVTEALGLTLAVFPGLWTGLFTNDPAVASVGASYLRIVGPFYGSLGAGLLLYFAAQAFGRMTWPLIAGFARLVVAAGGGWLAATASLDLGWIFTAVALGTLLYGLLNGFGFSQSGGQGSASSQPA